MKITEAIGLLHEIVAECGDIDLVVVEHHHDHWEIVDALDIQPIIHHSEETGKRYCAAIERTDLARISLPEPHLTLIKS